MLDYFDFELERTSTLKLQTVLLVRHSYALAKKVDFTSKIYHLAQII